MKQRMDWVRFVPPEISDQLNEQARRLLGFDTRLPTNLEEFFLPQDQRLYKANQG
jgi:ectoine hydroxylase-related dioxygenase (phytanoyl-CoA dioxygenase family)